MDLKTQTSAALNLETDCKVYFITMNSKSLYCKVPLGFARNEVRGKKVRMVCSCVTPNLPDSMTLSCHSTKQCKSKAALQFQVGELATIVSTSSRDSQLVIAILDLWLEKHSFEVNPSIKNITPLHWCFVVFGVFLPWGASLLWKWQPLLLVTSLPPSKSPAWRL